MIVLPTVKVLKVKTRGVLGKKNVHLIKETMKSMNKFECLQTKSIEQPWGSTNDQAKTKGS
jgi:hypothetical protein